MQHVSEAESTIDIIMFAEQNDGKVRVAAGTAKQRAPLPSNPEFRVPELSHGDVVIFRPGSALAHSAAAIWAMPKLPEADSTRMLDIDELAGGPRHTAFSRAPTLRNRLDIQAYLKRHFPHALRRVGGDVQAIVWLLIDARGSVFKAVLHNSSGREDTDSVAVQASYLMRFDPAEQAGKSVPVWVQQPVRFHVQDVY
jgi:TonB family protein